LEAGKNGRGKGEGVGYRVMQRGSNGWMDARLGMSLADGSATSVRPPSLGARAPEYVYTERPIL